MQPFPHYPREAGMRVYVGHDRREERAYRVCEASLRRFVAEVFPISSRLLGDLYRRPEHRINGVLWDDLSNAPMATEFSIARFFVPHVANSGWVLFCDGDFLWRESPKPLFDQADPKYAVYVVKHDYVPQEKTKMDGQPQTQYARKNWSSLILWNLDHPSNRRLTLDELNTRAGRDLHRFCWLEDHEIGELGREWNWLVGVYPEPKAIHFTLGVPDMPGYEHQPYADNWRTLEHQSSQNAGCI